MKKLHKGLESLKIARTLLDMAAAKPGEETTFEEVWKAAGFATGQQARSSLGAFTKVIKRDFKDTAADWPVRVEFGPKGEAIYKMTPAVAKAWLDTDPGETR